MDFYTLKIFTSCLQEHHEVYLSLDLDAEGNGLADRPPGIFAGNFTMSDDTNIYLDANLDLRELAVHLLPDIMPVEDLTLHRVGGWLQYRFYANGGRPKVFLYENMQEVYYKSDTSSYRYTLSADGGPQFTYMSALYDRLLGHGCFPLAYQKYEGKTDYTYQPPDFSPDYSLVTRLMPVELLLWTELKERALVRELKRLTGLNFNSDAFFKGVATRGASGYIAQISKYERQDLNSRYSGTTASHYIRIFGIDDNPAWRRDARDALARGLLSVLRERTNYRPEAFEVIACDYVPFV